MALTQAAPTSPSDQPLPRIPSRTFQIAQPATDYGNVDLREFKTRLAEGFNLTKHSRSGKPSQRVIYTVDDGVHFRMAKGRKGQMSKLLGTQEFSLLSLAKVRMGTDKDPEHENKTGSNPLRQGCPTEEALRRGFTLVYLSRTVAYQATSPACVLELLGISGDANGYELGVVASRICDVDFRQRPALRVSSYLDFECETEEEMHYIVGGFRAMVAESVGAGAGSAAFGSQSWIRKTAR